MMRKEEIGYQAEVRTLKKVLRNIVFFYDTLNILQKLQITKSVFLQFFGTHWVKIISNVKHYHIVYKEECFIELSHKEYKKFTSFKSENIKINNINSRYIEHFELIDLTLYKCMLEKQGSIENILYKKDIID